MERTLGGVPDCQLGGGGIDFTFVVGPDVPGRYHDRSLIVSGESLKHLFADVGRSLCHIANWD